MIKAAYFDVDGTLVNFSDHKLSETDRESLDALRAKGIKIFLATGRHITAIDKITYPVDGLVSMNGSLSYIAKDGPAPVQDTDAFKVVGSNPFPPEIARAIADVIEERRLATMVNTATANVINRYDPETEESLDVLKFPRLPVVPVMEAIRQPVYEFTIFVTPEQERPFFGPLLDHMVAGRWCTAFTDFNHKGVSKGLGIDQTIEYLGYKLEETISFGDGGNDIPMLRHAGIGVAMDNSLDIVKQAADFITKDVEENGVTYALKTLGII